MEQQGGTAFDQTVDVVVIGSGSAALTAALTAARKGASVAIFEKSDKIGGTSAMSGAGTWIPANRHMKAAGIEDSPDRAFSYLKATAPEGWHEAEQDRWRAFVDNAPEMLDFVESNTPLEFKLTMEADPLAEFEGGCVGGRTLSPKLLSRRILGPYAKKLRRSTLPHIFTYHEMSHDIQFRFFTTILKQAPKLLWRLLTEQRGQGSALMTGLLKGCLDAGCTIETQARAVRLIMDDYDTVVGAVIKDGTGKTRTVRAVKGLLLGTGGFEWNADLFAKHFPGPVDYIGSPRSNEGDGQLMALSIGAKLDRMDQINNAYLAPTRYEGRIHGIPLQYHTVPNAMLVNRHGKRFVSEYKFNLGETLEQRDQQGRPVHLPAWLITDRQFFRDSVLLRMFSVLDRRWIKKGRTLDELARVIELPPAALAQSLARYNELARKGVDEDFGRGETPLEKERAEPLGLLAPIVGPPYYAIAFNRQILGTKGGVSTNARGQALRPDGSVIAGLYCAGLTMANPIGSRAVGSGTTIGPNMTWGYICAKAMLTSNR